jgi:hypothetical protein
LEALDQVAGVAKIAGLELAEVAAAAADGTVVEG